jgi:hypothetical protein
MRVKAVNTAVLTIACAMCGNGLAADLTASCQAPGWDMGREVSAFKSTAENLPAGASSMDLPPLEIGTLYVLKLRPQSDVQFLQTTAKASLVQNPLAGMARFTVPTPGNYRVTVDSPLWIDIVAPGGTIPPARYNGWHECRLFRKTVEYTLRAGQMLVLQLSEATPELVRVVIEPGTP